MELNPSWEAPCRSATQKFIGILWNPKVHYPAHKNLPLAPSWAKSILFLTCLNLLLLIKDRLIYIINVWCIFIFLQFCVLVFQGSPAQPMHHNAIGTFVIICLFGIKHKHVSGKTCCNGCFEAVILILDIIAGLVLVNMDPRVLKVSILHMCTQIMIMDI
jgi:hypothetical protein